MAVVMSAGRAGGMGDERHEVVSLCAEFPTVPEHVVAGIVRHYREAIGPGDDHDPEAMMRLARASLAARVAAQEGVH